MEVKWVAVRQQVQLGRMEYHLTLVHTQPMVSFTAFAQNLFLSYS